jgi:hypothetical protein
VIQQSCGLGIVSKVREDLTSTGHTAHKALNLSGAVGVTPS